jgi:hypothetical protein
MRGILFRSIGALAALLIVSGAPEAALIDRGGGFIYDDVLDITWTQDANINGLDTWDNQVAWAAGLSLFDSVRNVTWSDWRLASMDVNGDSTSPVDCSSATELACRDNEYGYLFYQNGISFGMPGLFTNVQSSVYWSGTEWPPDPTDDALLFRFSDGLTFGSAKNTTRFTWAVRDGDVAAVPVPAAAWLFGSALGLLGLARRRQA